MTLNDFDDAVATGLVTANAEMLGVLFGIQTVRKIAITFIKVVQRKVSIRSVD